MNISSFNISSFLPQMALERPDQAAVIVAVPGKKGKSAWKSISFKDLDLLCDRYCHGLSSAGIKPGMRVLLMVKPSFDFIALTFALFKTGAVPILIDPGMGIRRLLDCIRDVSPDALVGIPLAHLVKLLFPRFFRSVRVSIVTGGFWFSGISLEKISPSEFPRFPVFPAESGSEAAILFTTGSTGPAKGVCYEHGMFQAQVKLLKELYGFAPGEVDLAGLPVFALFDTALGMTCVVPEMDPSHPADVNPEKIVAAVIDNQVTTSFGSPAIWKKVSSYCLNNSITLPSVRRVLMAGAPVSGKLIGQFQNVIPSGDVFTPYGATESLPVSSISGKLIMQETWALSEQGAGTCVGNAVPGVQIKIIRISDQEITFFSPDLELETGETGEIIVRGDAVTRSYFNRPTDTARSKIRDHNGGFWHRIGDTGYLDHSGKLWFCGRKNHRVILKDRVMFTIPCEAIFNLHPHVSRSALVGVSVSGVIRPVMIIEPEKGFFPLKKSEENRFRSELESLASSHAHTRNIEFFLFHRSFPVDIRHNAKIFREKLQLWAQEKFS